MNMLWLISFKYHTKVLASVIKHKLLLHKFDPKSTKLMIFYTCALVPEDAHIFNLLVPQRAKLILCFYNSRI